MAQQSEFLPPVLPTSPESISSPAIPQLKQDFRGLIGTQDDDMPMYRHWVFSAQVNGSVNFVFTDGQWPDYWIGYLMPTAGTTVAFFQSPIIGSEPELLINGGGSFRIPATSEYLSWQVRAGTATIGIFAVRKSDYDVIISPGNA